MTTPIPTSESPLPKVLHRLENAFVTPTVVHPDRNSFSGCVYDQHGKLVPDTVRTSRNVIWTAENPAQVTVNGSAPLIGGTCLYLGHYTTHYGHFLLETLARFWIFEKGIPYNKVVFHPFIHSTPRRPLLRRLVRGKSALDVCFPCFGIRRWKTLIIRRPLRFTELLVPSPLIEINNAANVEQAAVYQRIADACNRRWKFEEVFDPRTYPPGKPLRLYLSRSKLVTWLPGRVVRNEEQLESLFASFGFHIIHPQSLPFPHQVLLYSRAEAIAGVSGSAMHNSLFMKRGGLAIALGSPREGDQNHQNQVLCDAISGARSEFIRFQGQSTDDGRLVAEYDMDYLKARLVAMGL